MENNLLTENTSPISVYFAGSIRGDKKCTEIYPYIIEQLKKYFTVLSEHLDWLHREGEEINNLSNIPKRFKADQRSKFCSCRSNSTKSWSRL